MSIRGRIARAALLIALGNVASRLLGVAREQVIAALFGATGLTDAFVAASTIPTAIYDLLVGGAISAALIPVFSDYGEDEESELWQLASIVITLVVLFLAGMVLALALFAPQLVQVLGQGFEEKLQRETVWLVRLMLPALVFMGLSGVTTALLYSRQSFVFPAFAIAAYNAGLIVVAMTLAGRLGVTSLVLGVMGGALLQFAIQLPGLRRMVFRPTLRLGHPQVRRIGTLYVPVALGLVVSTVGVFIDRNLASRTGEGNMAAMRFATALVQFPLGLVATALSHAVLPTLSRQAQLAANPDGGTPRSRRLRGDPEGEAASYTSTLALGLRLVLLAILPATVLLVLFRLPIIQLLYERGRFVAHDTLRTGQALLFYAPQLPFAAIDQLLIVAFYARKNTLTPVLVGLLGVGVYLAVALPGVGRLGMPGLALANTVQNSIHAAILFGLLWRELRGMKGQDLAKLTGKAALAASLMGAASYFLAGSLGLGGSLAPAQMLVRLLATAGLGALVYAVVLWLLRVEEMRLLWSAVVQRFSSPFPLD